MEQTLKSFKEQQAKMLKLFDKLQKFLAQGKTFGIDIDPKAEAKLERAIHDLENEKLRVALIGGFSEGKTAIAAAWLERLDKSTMEIKQEESTNAVTVYEAGPDCLLVDTPGLFGFKEQFDEQTNMIEKYRELTRKYVSEAHLVLYVMDPVNPIKESHRDELTWLFRSLNLLPRTVFVLSRFDAVADVEDEHEFERLFAIKKDNVVGRLRDLIALTDAEAAELAVVAVAADPFGMGTEYWLNHIDRFRALSRIGQLQRATSEKIRAAGGTATIKYETWRSIVRDILDRQLPIVIQNEDRVVSEVSRFEAMNDQITKQLNLFNVRIKEARTALRQFVTDFFTDLILQAKGQSLETFVDFFERNIGSEGAVLNTNLQNAFDQQIHQVQWDIAKMIDSFDTEVSHFNAIVGQYGKQGINTEVNHFNAIVGEYSKRDIKRLDMTVLAGGNSLVGVARVAGQSIPTLLSPWATIKVTAGLTVGTLASLASLLIGIGAEVWDTLEQMEREEKFREMIDKIVAKLEEQRKELLDLINGQKFEAQFFPELVKLRTNISTIGQAITAAREKREQLHLWHKDGEEIAAELQNCG